MFLLIIRIEVAFEAIIMDESPVERMERERERPEGNGASLLIPHLRDPCVLGTGGALGRDEAHRMGAAGGGGYKGY